MAASYWPEEAQKCQDFLRHKKYLLSPTILKSAGIKVTTTIQRPGDAIITYPGCYHWGFNTGFNVAESSNFAVPEWVPAGRRARACMCVPHSVKIDMDRFVGLLSRFEDSQPGLDAGYTAWAKAERGRIEVRRAREARRDAGRPFAANREWASLKPWKATRDNIVLVAFLDGAAGSAARRIQAKGPGARAVDARYGWKMARRAKDSALDSGARVLCLLPAMDLENRRKEGKPPKLPKAATPLDEFKVEFVKSMMGQGEKQIWFEGRVTERLDGQVRVHFQGLKKDDDLWIEAGR